MSTTKHTGVRNHNPNVANSPAGSEGTVNPSAVLPSVATPPTTGTPPAAGTTPELTPSQLLAVETAVKTFREGYIPLVMALFAGLRAFQTRDTAPYAPVSGARKQVATLYAELLRENPDITAAVNPDVIDAGLAVDTALAMFKSDFQKALPVVASFGRRAANISWSETTVVRSAAQGLARKDDVLKARIGTINALLRRGSRVATTANAATRAHDAAAKAQQKAERAVAKAARAAAKATRTAQVHADNHPTPDVVIVPAGTTTPATPPGGTPPKG